jgi:hypothetical protein
MMGRLAVVSPRGHLLAWRLAGMIGTLVACGDNFTAGDASRRLDAPDIDAIDAPPRLPDLQLVGAEMDGSVVITQDVFTATSCEVVEQCVGGTGARRLLRFDTVTANLGTGDLYVGMPPPPGESDGVFVWSSCHMHHHVNGYASYELRDATGVVLTGHKQAFCLQDIEQLRPGSPSNMYNCAKQGMSAGWADVYGRALPCQWLDVTDVPTGTYTLRVVINPSGALPDSDLTNNEWTLSVSI